MSTSSQDNARTSTATIWKARVAQIRRTVRIMERVEIPIVAPSLGGVESLLSRPATTSHLAVPPEERTALGISDGLIRMSVGIESLDDLIDDFRQAIG